MQAGQTKSERKASQAKRAEDRPAKRLARATKNIERRINQNVAAQLREDRKRSYLATYTEARKAERRKKLGITFELNNEVVAPAATIPAEAVTNEAR